MSDYLSLRIVLSLALSVCSASGCGYRFRAATPSLPEGIKTVSAPVFVNKTSEPGLELIFTEAMRQQLVRAGVAAKGSADAEIQGEVRWINNSLGIFTITSIPASYYIEARIGLKLVKGSRSISDADMTAREDYLPGRDILETEANRAAALRRVAEQLVRDCYDRLATGWTSSR
jgi:hypothetical protein